MTQDRRKIVLNAIVRDYVATREPVGSKGVVERYNLCVSPATVRNDMAQLEEAGLIVQPHTSAGRIPTQAGYRAFVDSIGDIKPLTRAERAAIEQVLAGAVDLDDVIARATKALATITKQVAIVQYPSLRKTTLRHVEVVTVGERHLLVVIITDAGRVEQRTIATPGVDDVDLVTVRRLITEAFAGKHAGELGSVRESVTTGLSPKLSDLAGSIADVIIDTLQADAEERVVVAGAKNLARYGSDFHGSISTMLDVLEEQVVLLRMLANTPEPVSVHIGRENDDEALAEASLVSAAYGGGESQAVARLGVIGPTRMDYHVNMAGVMAVAGYLSDILGTN